MYFQLTENALIDDEFYEQGDVFQLPSGCAKEFGKGRLVDATPNEPRGFEYGQSTTVTLPTAAGRFYETWQQLMIANTL